eukprot:gene1300-276_t
MKFFLSFLAGVSALSINNFEDMSMDQKKQALLQNKLKTKGHICEEMCEVVFFDKVLEKCAVHCDSAADKLEAEHNAHPEKMTHEDFITWLEGVEKWGADIVSKAVHGK